MRELDRLTTERCGIPSRLLMESAATAAARTIGSVFSGSLAGLHALILCGRGNNGGDGAALALALWAEGAARVEVFLFGRVEETRGDARANFEIVRQLASTPNDSDDSRRLSFVECDDTGDFARRLDEQPRPQIIVDALFGTGLTRPLEGAPAQVVSQLSFLRAERERSGEPHPFILSLDIPSGLNADSADPNGDAVRADATVTFTAPKPANVLPPASHFNGQLSVAEIGTPAALVDESPSQLFLVEAADARAWLERTRYAPDSFKNTHGHALIIAGSRNLTGAAVLCSEAAMRSGTGLVTVATPASALASVAARVMPEVMTADLAETDEGAASDASLARLTQLAARADVIAIGPGLTSDNEATRRLVRVIVEQRTLPVVLDADALNALAPWSKDLRGSQQSPLILTPHVGEMRRLLGVNADDKDALRDRVTVAREFAVAHELIVVFKGSRTITAAPDGRVFVNPTGNAGLGTAGAGDTLTGIIAGFVAQARGALGTQSDVLEAVIAAIYVGGLAGDLAAREHGMRTMVASDIREHFGAAVRALDPMGEQP
jgi:NAD(P)H-hydrate epimerase